jgi:hypothetical protein
MPPPNSGDLASVAPTNTEALLAVCYWMDYFNSNPLLSFPTLAKCDREWFRQAKTGAVATPAPVAAAPVASSATPFDNYKFKPIREATVMYLS